MFRILVAVVCTILVYSTAAHAADPSPPLGRLPGTVKPTAYRLQLTIDPAAKDFSGHTEIDAELTQPARTLFLHGNGLKVSKAQVTASGSSTAVSYTQVDDSGVARLDLPRQLPIGTVTLSFDYTAAFRTGAEGLFHAEVAGDWYAWTQMEPIDARRMFPGFDEPGFKTPFTVTVTAPKNLKVFANAPETNAATAGAMIVHRFAPTAPLPTYLVAVGVGPFDVVESVAPPNAVRKQPLPMRVIATKGQLPRMQLSAVEGPKLLALLEQYLGIAYPFPKLDLLGTPLLGGAMENAGLIIYDDTLLLLDPNPPFRQLRSFAEVHAHEMAHQWFGDLVTPSWWTDIWLNESFAEWMGKKISNQWRADLGIAASELTDAFSAMDTDSLARGRPIRQEITENRQISGAFDSITYKKGAQVLSMFESYLGPEKFAQGVKLHLGRYRFGNASADDFFRSLGEAANDAKIVPAMRTFTDQMGVPMVALTEHGNEVSLSQSRYRPLGVEALAKQNWNIPFCMARGGNTQCMLFDTATSTASVKGDAALMPNAGGSGYYRFRLDDAGWDRLIATAGKLPGREALALGDSVWSDFIAGSGKFDRVVAAARALSVNPERLAVIDLGYRLKGLADTAFTADQRAAYQRLMQSIYGARLAALGLDLRRGAHAKEPASTQALRQSLVPLVALEGRDPAVRKQLLAAAEASLGGDAQAIDPAFRISALIVAVQERGGPFMKQLTATMVKSTDPLFRSDAAQALGSADTPTLAATTVDLALTPGVQSLETVQMLLSLSERPGSRDTVVNFADKHFQRVMDAFPGFARPEAIGLLEGYCDSDSIQKVDAFVRPKLKELGGGELRLEQTKDRIKQCVTLKQAKGAEISAGLGR